MEKESLGHFSVRLQNKKEHYPWNGQIELTYRCNLNCIHCYCKGSEDKDKELTTVEWKNIFDEIHKEGCLYLTFTGGDPLVREDFLDLYFYAKKKGFIITLFTNGQAFTDETIDYLVESPPFFIEITLNSLIKKTYESIVQVEGSFKRVMHNIKRLKENKMPLILKTNCLKQNKQEVSEIKRWTEELLGKPSDKRHYFKYDPMIYPRLNGDKIPSKYRLSFEELLKVKKQDPDFWEEYERGLHGKLPDLRRGNDFLYRCDSWMSQFFINPYGRLKFCAFSDKFSVDLKSASFKEGFYNIFPQLLNEKFKTNSKCKDCSLKPVCYHCPARAYLETGNEEAPVEHYCDLARETAKRMKQQKSKN